MDAEIREKRKKCSHSDCCVVGFFVDDFQEETYLIQTCDTCGKTFYLIGEIPEIVA